ncbi:MAG: internalin-J, partial [Actinomycetota bacterium]
MATVAAVALTTVGVMGASPVHAASSYYVNGLDPLFEQKLIDLGIDTTIDQELDLEKVEAVTSLNLTGLQSPQLTGLELFKNLQTLNLTDVNQLTYLYWYQNGARGQLSNLILSGNTALSSLAIVNHRLTSFSTVGLPALQSLSVDGNFLSSIDLSGSPLLSYLSVSQNRFSALAITN